jgi:hypothetical protein
VDVDFRVTGQLDVDHHVQPSMSRPRAATSVATSTECCGWRTSPAPGRGRAVPGRRAGRRRMPLAVR